MPSPKKKRTYARAIRQTQQLVARMGALCTRPLEGGAQTAGHRGRTIHPATKASSTPLIQDRGYVRLKGIRRELASPARGCLLSPPSARGYSRSRGIERRNPSCSCGSSGW